MNYYKNGQITNRPRLGVINPSHETILSHGWIPYIDQAPEYNPETHRLNRLGVIDGVRQYEVIEMSEQEIIERQESLISVEQRIIKIREEVFDMVDSIADLIESGKQGKDLADAIRGVKGRP